jgi:hypothetical protein
VEVTYHSVAFRSHARGAGFDQAADDPLAAAPVVILGYDYWQNNLAADPDLSNDRRRSGSTRRCAPIRGPIGDGSEKDTSLMSRA